MEHLTLFARDQTLLTADNTHFKQLFDKIIALTPLLDEDAQIWNSVNQSLHPGVQIKSTGVLLQIFIPNGQTNAHVYLSADYGRKFDDEDHLFSAKYQGSGASPEATPLLEDLKSKEGIECVGLSPFSENLQGRIVLTKSLSDFAKEYSP